MEIDLDNIEHKISPVHYPMDRGFQYAPIPTVSEALTEGVDNNRIEAGIFIQSVPEIYNSSCNKEIDPQLSIEDRLRYKAIKEFIEKAGESMGFGEDITNFSPQPSPESPLLAYNHGISLKLGEFKDKLAGFGKRGLSILNNPTVEAKSILEPNEVARGGQEI